jgi:NADPH:quinone reductase-like Zn-dependent oxidoreductase
VTLRARWVTLRARWVTLRFCCVECLGNHVIATCSSPAKVELLLKLGADRVVDYKTESLKAVLRKEYPKGLDLVYESVGGEMFRTAVNALADKGRLVIIGMMSQYTAGVDGGWELPAHKGLPEKLLNKSTQLTGFFLPHYAAHFPRHLRYVSALDGDRVCCARGVWRVDTRVWAQCFVGGPSRTHTHTHAHTHTHTHTHTNTHTRRHKRRRCLHSKTRVARRKRLSRAAASGSAAEGGAWRSRLHALLATGQLTVAVDPTPFVGLEAVAAAVEHLHSGRSVGKVVVRLHHSTPAELLHAPPALPSRL